MSETTCTTEGHGNPLRGRLISLVGSRRVGLIASWIALLAGLAVWTAVQTTFVAVPLWTRALPPEVDDSLTYVLKTKQMEECFFQDCLALEDLRRQFHSATSDKDVIHQRNLAASRIYPIYHPLLSVVFLGLKALGWDLMTVYKIVWTAGPCLFGLAFASLLASLWGLPAAGAALSLLAFKVFPDTGLHHVVPSNIAMAMAALLWARIISRSGDAPWSLIIGAAALVAMHPVGRIYSVMAAFFAVSLSGLDRRPRTWLPVLITAGIVALPFGGSHLFRNAGIVDLSVLPDCKEPIFTLVSAASRSLMAVIVETVRLEGGLLGAPPLFCGAVGLGFLVLPRESRKKVVRITSIYLLTVLACLFYVASHPGDLILRIWIPLIVILFGAVGNGIWYCLRHACGVLLHQVEGDREREGSVQAEKWAIVALAVLAGYCFQMVTLGAEQIAVTMEHLKNREPLRFDPAQPEMLLSRAGAGDRVLYTSMIIMPYYFIQGAMKLGAVYYHPSMERTPSIQEWLRGKDLRFAVTYNPMVTHPSFEGLDETDWWISAPEYRYTELTTPRRSQPVSREGEIHAADFRWIEVAPGTPDFPRTLKMLAHNPGRSSHAWLKPVDRSGAPLLELASRTSISSGFSGWIEWDVKDVPPNCRFRIVFPEANPAYRIAGLVFGDDRLHWPWAQKAELSFAPREAGGFADPIVVSFDPAKVLPPPLTGRKIDVLNDDGSSVLFELDPSREEFSPSP
jgi:hypothetical protein